MKGSPPPKKWEAWAAAFFLVIYLANVSASGAEAPPINDFFLVVSIVWFIAIGVRSSRYKKSVAGKSDDQSS